MTSNRRKFLQTATRFAAGVGIASLPGSTLATSPGQIILPRKFSANETVRVGLIGCKNMGWHNLSSVLKNPGAQCIALCDVDSNILNARASELEKNTGKKAKLYGDYRQLLENKDIDAVIIGTPDHWHCLQMVNACEAGKDIYVEKPIANSIEECNLMVKAANRYGRVVQVGQWQRSDPHWINALEFLKSGKLGKIRSAKAWAFKNYGRDRDVSVKPDGPVPPGVDYDMWLGPAPKRPFNPNRFHGSFRYFWDYAGGLMTDWGVHMIDMILAGMNVSSPLSVAAIGGKLGYPESGYETPDTLQALYDFGTFSMTWEQSLGTGRGPYGRDYNSPGVAFIGNDGTLVITRDNWEVHPEQKDGKNLIEAIPAQKNTYNGLDHHTVNWLECIKSRNKTNCTIEMGRNSALNAQLGNIAYRLGDKVTWDESKNLFVNDSKANEMVKPKYREPWKLPVV